jgi:hypothetical protein
MLKLGRGTLESLEKSRTSLGNDSRVPKKTSSPCVKFMVVIISLMINTTFLLDVPVGDLFSNAMS